MILLTLGRIYGGQKINGQSLYYLIIAQVSEAVAQMVSRIDKCQMISRIDMKTGPSTEGVKVPHHKSCLILVTSLITQHKPI